MFDTEQKRNLVSITDYQIGQNQHEINCGRCGRIYPSSPSFGTPCPTVIFTFGLLIWMNKKLAKYLLIIPVLWAFIGTSAAFNFGVKEDFGLFLAATIGTAFIFRRDFTPEKRKLL